MDKRKRAAISAAVLQYIRTEEEAVCLGAMRAAQPAAAAVPSAPPKMWGASGRQQQMQLRNMMQWRAFHGARLR